MTIQHSLKTALGHHQAGRLADARTLYLEILREQPDEPDVLHLVGLVARQMGQLDVAIDFISRAIRLRPDFAEAQNNLGVAFRVDGQLEESIAAFGRAIRIKPDFPEAFNNLGHGLMEARRLDEAIAACREAIRLRPQYSEAHNNLGNALADKGLLNEAVAAYRRVIQINPSHSEAHNNLGNALREMGSFEESIAAHGRALQLRPNYAEAHSNLGNALRAKGRLDEAISAYQRAIQYKPGYAEAHHNLAVALGEIGRYETAIEAASKAIALKPDLAQAHNNLGKVLRDLGRLDQAIESFERALKLAPEDAEAHNNLAVALKDQGRLDEALSHFDRVLASKPNHTFHSNRIYLLHFHPGYDSAAIESEQAKWDGLHAEPLRRNLLPHGNDRRPDRRLRIGYIAPYFRKHVVGFNILPLLREHEHRDFEIFAYSDVRGPDEVTSQCRSHADCWREIFGMSDPQVAEMIRADRIDILVDLSQHLSDNRLLVLARKPAPVQAVFAAYPGGTGLRTIDYRLTDPHLDPAEQDLTHDFEQPVRLADSFWCYDESAMSMGMGAMPPAGPIPALGSGRVTFGCLNNFCKINDGVLPGNSRSPCTQGESPDLIGKNPHPNPLPEYRERGQGVMQLWAQVLNALPNSGLLLLAPEGCARIRAAEQMAKYGVDPKRIEFAAHEPRARYFQLYHRIDVSLDTFPYGGHTTSLDSLWMGVPVVTLAGATAVGRAGVSQLTNLGLTELIARTPEDYVRIATELAGDLNRLGRLRSTLRDRMRNSPLTDAARFARNIEAAYRTMWETWCAGEFISPKSS